MPATSFSFFQSLAESQKSDSDPWSQDYLANSSIGAGAFMLDSWERGSTMTMKKFDGYHLGWDDQAIDEVRFVFTNEEGAVKALAASGTLSMSSDDQTQETYDAIDSMIDEARSTGDVAAQNEIYKAMQRKLVDQQSDVYLLTQTSQQAFSECIDGFTWVPMQSFEFNFHTMKWVCE